ncbi:hypothetical protein CG007_01910 [Mesoplasma entomophilum]|uniref:Uncharacterized protein n=1 Tax=Mesoplasma entomophilum TaxID=2149 RepID=A0A3S5XZ50_9MOLU|nr:hypothetical protein [Mesoplasma entomophilum]ATQ35523.1 hypothetical protein CS528_01940 [Mesoplasma entomophilum]ATZ19483.1 hypothetical protein MENTO_v1c03770 [Mesoplasma entomophilum]AVN60372.1 hypothetical protein CG007_01910 [Mesoplasma entomophilum]
MNNDIMNGANQQNPNEQNQIKNPNYVNSNNLAFGDKKFIAIAPEFTKKELEAVNVNKRIAKEIKMEKYKIAFLMFTSIICSLVSAFFIALNYIKLQDGQNFLKIKPELVPSAAIMISILILSLIVMVIALIDLRHILIDVKGYKTDLLMGKERIPFFIIKSYKKIVKRHIYLNWTCFGIYLYGGLTTLILFLVNKSDKVSLDSEIMIFIIVLSLTAVIQIFSLMFNYSRKGNIDSFYGYEIIPLDQQLALKKAANKFCMLVFFTILAIVLFVIFIPYFIMRKKSDKKLWWFL